MELSSCYMVQKGPKWCKKFQKRAKTCNNMVLMWCICGKPKTLKPEKREVLMVHLWWCCGAHEVRSRIRMKLGRIRMELG